MARGGRARRGGLPGGAVPRLVLLVWPSAPDVQSLYSAAPVLGGVAVLLGLALALASWGRPWVAVLLSGLVLLAPTAPASAQLGLVADRYFYLPVALLLASLAPWVDRWLARHRVVRLLWVLPVLLATFTAPRARAWTSDGRVFGDSLARDPHNDRAAFHVAYDLHLRRGDCASAVPLYERARAVEARAGTNLQSCLLELGRLEEAAALGPEVVQAQPGNPNPAANTARALARLERPAEALVYADLAIERDPDRASSWILVGNLRGMTGDLEGARAAFESALALEPGSPEALAGLVAVEANSPR